ncbi:hypothetical protein HFN89_38905 [Rhizobium laguerreae]|nr:hypothetical protein [Rhizobium laguerreae]
MLKTEDLSYVNLTSEILKNYTKRTPVVSGQFLRWFFENILRLDPQDADDACVDSSQDKGIDGLYVNDVTEIIHLVQVKTRQKENSTLGDPELKEFFGSIQQFKDEIAIQSVLAGNTSDKLKQAIRRTKLIDKVKSGYRVEGIFVSNIPANKDADDYVEGRPEIALYDAKEICSEYIDLGAVGGIKSDFKFNVADTEVIKYTSSEAISARMFLADALQLLHLQGITDGKLFERNVRLSLGNTKVNKSLIRSVRDKSEHKNFPLYHNGINILCDEFVSETDEELVLRNYVVVNGAQSLTSLNAERNRISPDLKILVKAIEVKGDSQLADKITTNSNNQNAIKPRDLKANHGIQQRLKQEIESIDGQAVVYEVKRGEKHKGKEVISNEDVGLILLALDLGEPWSCHQRYKVMDESHSKIFGRPDVDGYKIIALLRAFEAVEPALDSFDDGSVGHYSLTRYFLAYAVAEIIKDSEVGKAVFNDFSTLFVKGTLDKFVQVFADIAETTVHDLNAALADEDQEQFDHKSDLKSPKWTRAMAGTLRADYKKDVKRKKVKAVDELLAGVI